VNKINKFFRKSVLVFSTIIGIGAVGFGTAYAAYTHDIYKPWGDSYQTATYKMQDTFSDLSETQTADAMVHWNGQLTKSFLYKSSEDTTATEPSKNGVKTITKNYYGIDGITAEHHPYYNSTGSYVVESDIRFNVSYPYANSKQDGKWDVQSVMTHELGHALRVGHSTIDTDTMHAVPSGTDYARNVTAADKEAARYSTSRWFN
jgi:predicted Zn-dependent protease